MTLCVSVYVSIYGEIIESNRDYRGSGNMINPHSHSFSLRGHITPLSMLLIGLISSTKHYVKDTIPHTTNPANRKGEITEIGLLTNRASMVNNQYILLHAL